MKKLIMFVMVLAIATPAVALVWPADAPSFAGCRNSGQVLWEFIDDGCMPTTDVPGVEAYYYDPELGAPTFGSRHWDDPEDDDGWGGSYDSDLWEWSDGVMTIPTYAEDSFNQPIPERGEHLYLRQYFEVVHTIPEEPDPSGSIIGLGLEIWDMSVYEPPDGWSGCPVGYEGLPGDGYLEGFEFPAPDQQYELGGGWWKSIWIKDFSVDDSIDTAYTLDADGNVQLFGDLFEATHAVCIIAMDMPSSFQLEEVYLNFIWFSDPQGRTESEGGDIPDEACYIIIVPQDPAVTVETVDIPVHEPQDTGGPPPMGPTEGKLRVKLSWQPSVLVGETETYPDFIAKVVVDPDPNQEHVGSSDFSFTNPVPPDPNGNVTLTFTQADWDTFQDITVKATKDLDREGPEGFKCEWTVTIDIDDPNFGGPDYDPVEPVTGKAGIQVVDNDIPYVSVLPAGALEDVLSENDPCVPYCVNVTLSHLPSEDVYVLVARESDWELLTTTMSVMDPPLEVDDDPNRLHFTSGTYNTPQVICLEARDDPCRPDSEDEWIGGTIIFTPYSEDLRYCVDWLTADPYGFPLDQDGDGEADEQIVNFNVQDNELGAWGFDPLDLNEDGVVNLSESVLLYDQWLWCTQPYEDGCDKLWNLGGEEEEEEE